ncbi:DUF2326 domain-containing protein [Clostridium botulinum]|uniref:DUF2326 domain-containing protein n=1 Tax=Clostridium botulinum TaxID=1491 RepID=UPI000D1235C6|nr:DUF2326 domain-containing protein [Clostridium botulinum]AVQ47463.1 hypothetical protein C7M60_17490 [Clostridium botulinum]AVQ50831.1 hypothetical protein C7M58_16480 [Clostridium botulinum]
MNSPLYINRIALRNPMGKCDVTLRKGLNVILSDDVSVGNSSREKIETRNSTGKTTFIHLIDYALGKERFINNVNEFNKSLFEDQYVICEISIYDKKYTIYRSILDNDTISIYENWILNSILSEGTEDTAYKMFDLNGYISFIENEIFDGRNYFKDKRIVSYRSIMNFIIRDQFFGFTKYYSGIKDEKAKVGKERIEFLFGLTTFKKLLIKEKIDKKTKEKNDLVTEYNVIRSYFSKIIKQNPTQIKREIRTNQKTMDDLKKQLDDYSIKISSLEIEKSQKKKEKDNLEDNLKSLNNDIAAIKSRISNYEKALNENKNELKKLDYIGTSIEILSNIDLVKCPVVTKSKELGIKIDVKCPIADNEENKSKNKQIIDTRRKLIEYEISDLEKAIFMLQSQHDEKLSKHKVINSSIEEVSLDIGNEINTILENRELTFNQLKEVEYSNQRLKDNISQYEYLNNLKDSKNEKTKEIKAEKEKIDELKNKGFNRIVEIYDDVVVFISNDSRNGTINKKNFEPLILFKNGEEDTGAGIKSISIIAFDLTMLTYALEKQSEGESNPYFNLLVHDSPKRNDIDLNMYKRVFDYVIKLENDYSNIDFQYIITTLDISEKVKEDKEKYIKLLLDNSGDGGKLFGITINI